MRDELAQLSQAQLNLSLALLSLHLDSVGVINALTGRSSAADVSVIRTWEFLLVSCLPTSLLAAIMYGNEILNFAEFPKVSLCRIFLLSFNAE